MAVLITGFPAGMLACNCYVLAKRTGADGAALGAEDGVVAADAVSLFESCLVRKKVATAAITTTTARADPTIA